MAGGWVSELFLPLALVFVPYLTRWQLRLFLRDEAACGPTSDDQSDERIRSTLLLTDDLAASQKLRSRYLIRASLLLYLLAFLLAGWQPDLRGDSGLPILLRSGVAILALELTSLIWAVVVLRPVLRERRNAAT